MIGRHHTHRQDGPANDRASRAMVEGHLLTGRVGDGGAKRTGYGPANSGRGRMHDFWHQLSQSRVIAVNAASHCSSSSRPQRARLQGHLRIIVKIRLPMYHYHRQHSGGGFGCRRERHWFIAFLEGQK